MAWRELVIKNFWWKLLSVVLAALMWLTIRKDIQPENLTATRRFETVRIEVRAFNSNHYQIFPESAVVEMDGPTEFLNQLQPKSIKAYVDLTGLRNEKKARKQIQIEPLSETPGEIKLSVRPPYVEVELLNGQ